MWLAVCVCVRGCVGVCMCVCMRACVAATNLWTILDKQTDNLQTVDCTNVLEKLACC